MQQGAILASFKIGDKSPDASVEVLCGTCIPLSIKKILLPVTLSISTISSSWHCLAGVNYLFLWNGTRSAVSIWWNKRSTCTATGVKPFVIGPINCNIQWGEKRTTSIPWAGAIFKGANGRFVISASCVQPSVLLVTLLACLLGTYP